MNAGWREGWSRPARVHTCEEDTSELVEVKAYGNLGACHVYLGDYVKDANYQEREHAVQHVLSIDVALGKDQAEAALHIVSYTVCPEASSAGRWPSAKC